MNHHKIIKFEKNEPNFNLNSNMLSIVSCGNEWNKIIFYEYVQPGSILRFISVKHTGNMKGFKIAIGTLRKGDFHHHRAFNVNAYRSNNFYNTWMEFPNGGNVGVKLIDKEVDELKVECEIIGSRFSRSIDFVMDEK